MKILRPAGGHVAYQRAAEIFRDIYAEITGKTLEIITEDDGGDAVIIGSDAVNRLAADLYLEGKIHFSLRQGSDDYDIFSLQDGKRSLLVLAGGRGRSTVYAVYRYFELFCGCRWFWDGDIVPKADKVPMENVAVSESPRFAYRGTRYFAHRSLHRFQAEHWGPEDWKTEIDWLMKKRLNLFMLRIGDDDLYQRAFPDVVDYPPEEGKHRGDADGYNDRTTAWPLRYRGELRKKVLEYAFSMDLMHPEDCGTMTHWYSRTPLSFLEAKKPKLLSQATRGYSEQSGLVWDVREDENLDNYFKLTETHIREFGRPELFHTIGLAERAYSDDPEANFRMKQYVYHRITERLATEYPNAPLLIASWDLWAKYTPEEVAALLKTFDPDRTILLDYTSDALRDNTFPSWDVIGKFPWIFGIFHAYQADTEIRGHYPSIEARMKMAAEDEKCCGFILWPELSHGDTFMTEYMAANAWSPLEYTAEERLEKFCADRYGENKAEMHRIWKQFWPFITMVGWDMGDPEEKKRVFTHKDICGDILFYMKLHPQTESIVDAAKKCRAWAKDAAAVVRGLRSFADTENGFLRRDIFDIVRTIVKRYKQNGLREVERLYLAGEDFERQAQRCLRLTDLLAELLGQSEDFSLAKSYARLQKIHPVNPAFENTLKENASAQYCRSQIYENIKYLYRYEEELCFEMLRRSRAEGIHPDAVRQEYVDKALENQKQFVAAPFASMEMPEYPAGSLAVTLEKIAQFLEEEA